MKYYFKVSSNSLLNKLDSIPGITREEFEYVFTELGKIGEITIQQRIKTSGTGFSKFRAGRGIGSSGRIRTGRMYDAVGYHLERGAKTLRLAVGFVKHRVEKYFWFQDIGFTNLWKFVGFGKSSGPNAPEGFRFKHWRTVPGARPSHTKGMFALRDAQQNMRDAEARIVGRAKAKITRRINKK